MSFDSSPRLKAASDCIYIPSFNAEVFYHFAIFFSTSDSGRMIAFFVHALEVSEFAHYIFLRSLDFVVLPDPQKCRIDCAKNIVSPNKI